jgi:hypothetical protein
MQDLELLIERTNHMRRNSLQKLVIAINNMLLQHICNLILWGELGIRLARQGRFFVIVIIITTLALSFLSVPVKKRITETTQTCPSWTSPLPERPLELATLYALMQQPGLDLSSSTSKLW